MKTLAEALEEYIQLGESADKSEQLELDGLKQITDFSPLANWTNLRMLSLRVCNIKSLESFPALPNLQILYLADNLISGSLESLSKLPKLGFVDLTNNRISDFASLAPLSSCPDLNDIRIEANPCITEDNKDTYRDEVKKVLPQVAHVDPEDDDDEDDEEDDDDEYEDEDDEEGEPAAKRARRGEDDEEEDDDNELGTAALLGGPLEDEDEDDYEEGDDDEEEGDHEVEDDEEDDA